MQEIVIDELLDLLVGLLVGSPLHRIDIVVIYYIKCGTVKFLTFTYDTGTIEIVQTRTLLVGNESRACR